jgi:dTDP-4-dehydrorhamnose reductase
VVNAAGYVRVDDAERDGERCWRENHDGPRTLAEACAAAGLPLVTFSTDLVFDGRRDLPYREQDPVAPLGAYGRAKAAAEDSVLELHPGALVIRTAAFFSAWDEANFAIRTLRHLAAGGMCQAYIDAVVSPTFVPDLVHTALDLLIDGERGVWHLANEGAVSWFEFGRSIAAMAGRDRRAVLPQRAPAWIPRATPLVSERCRLMRPLADALERWWCEAAPLVDATGGVSAAS